MAVFAIIWQSTTYVFKAFKRLQRKKTGAFIEAAVVTPYYLSKLMKRSDSAKDETASDLRKLAEHIGLAFQIKDDIFDYSDLEEIGKPTMSDLRDGKVTLPLIEALRRAPQDEAEHIRELGEMLAAHSETLPLDKALQEIKAFVLRFKGDEYAVQRMLVYKKQATEALSIFRDSPEKTSLLALLDYAINRIQ